MLTRKRSPTLRNFKQKSRGRPYFQLKDLFSKPQIKTGKKFIDLKKALTNPKFLDFRKKILQILTVSLELSGGVDHVVSVPWFTLKPNLERSNFRQSALKCSFCICRESFCDALQLVFHEMFKLRQITSEHASMKRVLRNCARLKFKLCDRVTCSKLPQ